jgi:hypothetical protein
VGVTHPNPKPTTLGIPLGGQPDKTRQVKRPNFPQNRQNTPTGTPVRNNTPASIGGNMCFRCGEAGHYANGCPKRNTQNTLGQFNNSGQRQTPQQQQSRNFIRGRVNHVAIETAQEAQDVVFGMFLVNSAPASVLFDSGGSPTFISAEYVAKYSIPLCTMPSSMLVN